MKKTISKKGAALVIFMIVMTILFLLFGALTYRIQTTMLISRNNYIETQAEATAQAAAKHALSIISAVGLTNFTQRIDPPNDVRRANEPASTPQRTYDLGVLRPQDSTTLLNNANINSLTNNQLNPDFSYRICVWQYDPSPDQSSIRIKIFVFYRNRLIKSYIFTIEQ
ncbi:MAG: hypothetical protein RMJ51_02950 [Candidatus Calescibacterium sp.]|nr:hypothetical protein [Candidatus Calescibacterium sp.]MDW8195183.1 hypothetical protein [Candidatus Calescibacterium sp.]